MHPDCIRLLQQSNVLKNVKAIGPYYIGEIRDSQDSLVDCAILGMVENQTVFEKEISQ